MNSNKAFLQAYKDQKGAEGEDIVQSCIEKALKLAEIKTYKTYRNVILQYPSMFGNYYGMTTEVDHIVVTRNFVFVFETKNHETYKSTNRLYWELVNGEIIISPLRQNHLHKLVLVSELGIDRECIKPIECFSEMPDLRYLDRYISPWERTIVQIDDDEDPNNVVLSFNDEDFISSLAYLFVSSNPKHKFDYEKVINKLDELVSKQKRMKLNELHLENVKTANEILTAQKGNYIKFEYSDVGLCPYCGQDTIKLLRFKPELEPGRKRRRYAYRTCFVCKNFKCSKYDKSQGDFDEGKIILSEDYPQNKKILGSNIQIKTIQERMGITEMESYVETVKSSIDKLNKEISYLEANNRNLKSQLESKENEVEKLVNDKRETNSECVAAKSELRKYKPVLFGLLYVKK